MTANNPNPATFPDKICRICGTVFKPKEWQIRKSDYECPSCKRDRQNNFNSNDPLFKAKRRTRNATLRVKEYNSNYQQRIKLDRFASLKKSARRKVQTEIEAGRIQRGSCSICNSPNAEAHHSDYSKPLDITWLCDKHHGQIERINYAQTSRI